MEEDYLKSLEYKGLTSRIKRLSDALIANGRKLYKHIDIGIEPNWFLVFRIIMKNGQTTISEISSTLKFAHPSVISIVKKMDKAGYLDIVTDTIDKRKQIIKLSTKAKKQLPEMEKVWQACTNGVQSIFSDDNFLKEFSKLEAALEKEDFFVRAMKELELDNIKIRAFKKSDTKAFGDLNFAWLNAHFYVEPYDEQLLTNPQKYIIAKGGKILMAVVGKEKLGTLALIPHNKKEVELGKMAVNKIHRGKGIGKKLLQAAIDLAKEEKYDDLILYSNTKLKPAIKLYKKLGFKKEQLEKTNAYERSNIKMRLALK